VPLIGAGYTHFWNPDCSLDGTGIVEFGNGARTRIKRQLAAMRAAGIESLRLIMWNQHDPTGQTWGVVPSATGRLVEPYRSNFIAYLKDVRAAGFKQLTIAFGTQGPNSPLLYGPSGITDSGYDPSLFEENWRFIQDVRSLVKKYSGRAEDGDGVLHFGRSRFSRRVRSLRDRSRNACVRAGLKPRRFPLEPSLRGVRMTILDELRGSG